MLQSSTGYDNDVKFSGFRIILPLWVGTTIVCVMAFMLVAIHGTENCITQVHNLLTGQEYEYYAWIVVLCYFIMLATSVWSLLRVMVQIWRTARRKQK